MALSGIPSPLLIVTGAHAYNTKRLQRMLAQSDMMVLGASVGGSAGTGEGCRPATVFFRKRAAPAAFTWAGGPAGAARAPVPPRRPLLSACRGQKQATLETVPTPENSLLLVD